MPGMKAAYKHNPTTEGGKKGQGRLQYICCEKLCSTTDVLVVFLVFVFHHVVQQGCVVDKAHVSLKHPSYIYGEVQNELHRCHVKQTNSTCAHIHVHDS